MTLEPMTIVVLTFEQVTWSLKTNKVIT